MYFSEHIPKILQFFIALKFYITSDYNFIIKLKTFYFLKLLV